ncbi:MAG: SpoIIIAC/SpoIIIAD family protein [Clostridia bacterium]
MNVSIYFICAIVTAFFSLYLKQIKPEYALCVTLAGIVFILSGVIPRMVVIVSEIQHLSSLGDISPDYITPVLKIIGISYLTELTADICIDAGEKALSNHVQTVGKTAVLFIALPIVENVFRLIMSLLES